MCFFLVVVVFPLASVEVVVLVELCVVSLLPFPDCDWASLWGVELWLLGCIVESLLWASEEDGFAGVVAWASS